MKRILYIVLAVTLASCTSIEVHRTLKDVETYIAERPDSALAVIESIETPALKTKGLRAHHALLHAMALDKNYIDVTDDSLARKAVNYYHKHGPRKNYARSLYYLALSYYYDKQYDKSIIELSKAESIAEKYDSLFWGFAEVLKADIHSKNYNNVSELNALQKAYDIYYELDEEYYIDVAKRRLAMSYMNNEQYAKAEKLLEELTYSEKLNESLKTKSIRDYAFLMAIGPKSDYQAASKHYEVVENIEGGRFMSNQDYWVWAYSLSEIGEFDSCSKIVNSMKQIDSSCTAYHFMYLIAKNEGNQADALDYLEKFSEKNNEEVVQILKQSISNIQRDYYQSQYEVADIKANNRLLVIICIVVVLIFVTIITYLAVIRYRRKKEQEKEQYIRYAEEVNRQLRDFRRDTYSSLQKKYVSLYKTKYETLGTLFDQYVQSEGRINSEQIIYKKVVSLINELRREIGDNEEFEVMLNNDLNGIMTKLHSELPELKKKDYALFGYLALGFDATIISHFMDCTVNTVYIRKSRLKKAIQESETGNKSLFMEIIS